MSDKKQATSIVVEDDPQIPATAPLDGAAIHLGTGGTANCGKRGIAYCPNSGNATTASSGVAFVRNGGTAETGDGGVSVAQGAAPEASCASWGVAFARSESYANRGKVRGGADSVLVITWPESKQTFVRSIQVGQTDAHGTTIHENKWYTLEDDDNTKWKEL